MQYNTTQKHRAARPKINPATAEVRGLYLRGATYWLRFSVSGKQYRESLDTEDLAVAIEKARKLRQTMKAKSIRKGGASVFSEEILLYLADKQAEGTFKRKSAHARHDVLLAFSRELGAGHSCATVSRAMAQRWYDQKISTRSIHTVDGYMAWFKAFFNYAVRKGWCARNPMNEVKRKVDRVARARVNRVRTLSRAQLRQLIENSPTPELKFIFLAGGHASMRKDEILNAQAQWFDLDARTVTIQSNALPVPWSPKWGHSRVVPLTETFVAFLREFGLAEPYVLRPDVTHGQDVDRWDFDSPLKTYVMAQELPYVTSKVLRHSFGSIAASAGTNLFTVQKWMGHKSIRVTEKHYLHLVPGGSQVAGIFD